MCQIFCLLSLWGSLPAGDYVGMCGLGQGVQTGDSESWCSPSEFAHTTCNTVRKVGMKTGAMVRLL